MGTVMSSAVVEENRSSSLWKSLGPGILLAGAAIGGSHLFQSTRAGANFGWGLLWMVVLANVLKYPFFDYAIRYQTTTGKNLLSGYKETHSIILIIAAIVVFFSGALNIIALCVGAGALFMGYTAPLTAGLKEGSLAFVAGLPFWTTIVATLSLAIIFIGRYKALDIVTKVVISLLSFATVFAFFLALSKGAQGNPEIANPQIYISANLGFMLALMGWMPLPIDASIWPTLWNCEKAEMDHHTPTKREAFFDFNFGYISAAVLAFFFLGLGALVLYKTGADMNPSNIGFTQELTGMYGSIFGEWSRWLIGIAAATALFSSALTCLDAYPRTMFYCLKEFKPNLEASHHRYLVMGFLAVFYAIASIIVSIKYTTSLGTIVDTATTIAFLTAPVMAVFNLLVIYKMKIKTPLWLQVLGWVGLVFLTIFSALFIWVKFLAG